MKPVRKLVCCAMLIMFGAGCASVELHEQRFLAKPGMQFSDSPLLSDYASIVPQIETGAALSGGGQPTTCNACQ